jgi:diacylglycerol kinase family enzyme
MRGVDLARTVGWFWDDADSVGAAAAASSGHELTIASDAERAFYKNATAGVTTDVLDKVSSKGVDGAAALAYFIEQVGIESGN